MTLQGSITEAAAPRKERKPLPDERKNALCQLIKKEAGKCLFGKIKTAFCCFCAEIINFCAVFALDCQNISYFCPEQIKPREIWAIIAEAETAPPLFCEK